MKWTQEQERTIRSAGVTFCGETTFASLWAGVDELRATLARVEAERDEAIAREQIRRDRCDAAEAGMHLQVASAQARIAELREALRGFVEYNPIYEGRQARDTCGVCMSEQRRVMEVKHCDSCAWVAAQVALSRPDDDSALREMLTRACAEAALRIESMDVDANPQIDTPHKMWVACADFVRYSHSAIVARVIGRE